MGLFHSVPVAVPQPLWAPPSVASAVAGAPLGLIVETSRASEVQWLESDPPGTPAIQIDASGRNLSRLAMDRTPRLPVIPQPGFAAPSVATVTAMTPMQISNRIAAESHSLRRRIIPGIIPAPVFPVLTGTRWPRTRWPALTAYGWPRTISSSTTPAAGHWPLTEWPVTPTT